MANINKLPTVDDVIAETDQFIKAARAASFQGGFKRAQALDGIDSMPGSEHDSKVPENYGDPDPEVDDGSQGPKGSFDVHDGKEEITTKHVLDVTEPALSPDEAPLTTADFNAEPKTAADLANNLLANIKNYRTVKRAANQQLNIDVKNAKLQDKLAADKKDAPKPAEAPKAEAPKTEKKAEDKERIDALKAKLVGAVQATREAEKKAAEMQGARDALHDLLSGAYNKGVADIMNKLAQAGLDPAMLQGATPEGLDGQAAMADMAGAAAPAAPAEAAPAAPAEGGSVEAPEGTEGDEVTMEEVADALQDAVQSGEISPDDAEQIVTALVGAADSPEAAPSEEAKAAAVKFAEAINEADTEIQEAMKANQAQDAAALAEAQKFAQAIEEAASEVGAGDEGDTPTVEDVQEAVAELVDEGQIEPEAAAAILEEIGAGGEAPAEDKEASEKQAKDFADAIKEAADELGISGEGETTAAEDKGGEAPAGETVDPEALLEAVAELVDEGQLSTEDGEDILHAVIGGEE